MLEAIEQSDSFEIWPENVEPLNLFLRLKTQWRMGPLGPVGLDYAGVRAGLAMMGKRMSAVLFEDIQAMETAALKAMSGASDVA